MEYRKFWLETASGSVFNLTNPSFKVFGSSPDGLGFSHSLTTTRLGDINYLTSKVPSMIDKTFSIIFYGDDIEEIYRNYQNFANYLNTDETLYLVYELGNIGTYRTIVVANSLGKGEINPDDGSLTCSLSLSPLTFWEDNVENTETMSGSGALSKTITINGNTGTFVNVHIVGSVTNPTYSVEDSDGNVYGRGKITGTYTDVEVISDPANETIVLKNGSTTVQNPYNYQDLTVGGEGIAVTFLNLRRGSNVIRFSHDGSGSVTVTLTYKNRYVSV